MGKRGKLEPQATIGTIEKPSEVRESKTEIKIKKKSIPKKQTLKKSTQLGLPDGSTRTTIVISEDLLEKLQTLAFISKESASYYISEAISKFIINYEKNNGTIPILRKV